jgi:uncharacterized protein
MTGKKRENISFTSSGLKCSGWLYKGRNEVCVILAHGFACVKTMRLDAYAEKFNEAGYNVLVFDYRHFGDSEGLPRQLLNINKQIEDWHSAIAFARSQKYIANDKIVLWGSSFSGGHVAKVSAKDKKIAAVISQVPHLNGLASVKLQGWSQNLRLSFAVFIDFFNKIFGRSPYYIKIFGEPGTMAAMTGPGENRAAEKIFPIDIPVDRRVAARICFSMPIYSPGKYASKLNMPWLIQIAQNDITTPVKPAIKAAKLAPHAKLLSYNMGHFDLYVEPSFKIIIKDQLSFLKKQGAL